VLYGERLERAVLFGSQARGEATPASDIDILVLLRGTESFSLYDEVSRLAILSDRLLARHNELVTFVVRPLAWWTGKASSLAVSVDREGLTL